MIAPATFSFPASAGTVLDHAVADFTGPPDNTTLWPQGVMLTTKNSPLNWSEIGNCSPAASWLPVFDYDSTNRCMIMVGLGSRGQGRIWTYDVKTDTWSNMEENSKPDLSQSYNFGAYDDIKKEIIIVSSYGPPLKTYSFNTTNNTWTNKNPSQFPGFVQGYPMAFDSDRGETYLFGGMKYASADTSNELWSYNSSTNTWTNRTPAVSPPSRAYGSLVYDSTSRVLVLFGGNGTSWATGLNNLTLYNDTWVFDPEKNIWTNKSPAVSPSARDLFGMAYDKAHGVSILYGGIVGKQFLMASDTWAYNLSSNTWTNLTTNGSPPPRCGHSLAYDPANDKMVLVGGVSPRTFNWRADSWSYDFPTKKWTVGSLKAPSARSNHQMAYDCDSGKIILFGGDDGAYGPDQGHIYCGDTWEYDLKTDRWTLLIPTRACQQVAPVSGVRVTSGGTMAYDRRQHEMILYNEYTSACPGVFSFNYSKCNWTDKKSSDMPWGDKPVMAYDWNSGQMVVWSIGNRRIDLYDASSNVWTSLGLTGRGEWDASMVYLETSGEMLCYGTPDPSISLKETLIYNLTENRWIKLSDANDPPSRFNFNMAYDSFLDEVVLHGGRSATNDLSDTWIFNVSNKIWSKLETTGPPPRLAHTMVYDNSEREIILVGGKDRFEDPILTSLTFDRRIFREGGTYTSPIKDTNGTANFGTLAWNAEMPENTTIRVQIRSGANETAVNESRFIGPNGTTDDYYDASGQRINGVHNGSRMIQYKVFMNTSFERHSPILKSIQISYNLKHTVNITSPRENDKWTGDRQIQWKLNESDGDKVEYEIRLLDGDGGSIQLVSNLSHATTSWNWKTDDFRSGKYRIQVIARDDNKTIPLESNATSGYFFLEHPNQPPSVWLSRPDFGETVNSSSVRLEWNGSDPDGDDLEYSVYVGFEQFYFDSLPELKGATNDTQFTVMGLTDKTTYYWSVMAWDGEVNGTLPDANMFKTEFPIVHINHPPEVTLLAPADGENITTMSAQLRWRGYDADRDPLTYFVFVSEAGFNQSGLPPLFTRTCETSVNLTGLNDGATYYWAVVANDGMENGTGLTVWRFTVHEIIPPGTPRILGCSPKGARTPLNPAIQLSFDREMVSQSVFSSLVFDPPVDIGGFESSNDSVRFNFTFFLRTPLTPETTYNATVGIGAKGLNGKNLSRPFRWNFTTLAPGEIDTELPTIVFADPPNRATNVDRWKNITIMFSEAMALAEPGTICSIAPSVAGSWQWMNNRTFAVQFRPSAGFANGTYSVTVSTAARDEGGNPLDGNGNRRADGAADNYSFSFTVGIRMTGNPRLLTKSLVGEGVRTNAQLVLAFDRQMDPASVLSAVRISPAVEGNWTYDEDGKIFTFTPAKKFKAGTTYSVVIGSSAKDVDGNPLATEASWTFKTVETPVPAGIGMGEWFLLALVIFVLAGIAAFAVMGRKKVAGPAGAAGLAAPKGFAIEDIFLMYNDGRLIQHSTRRIKADMDVDIFTSMLTALQAFVKDSMGRGTGSELGSMEFGGDKILLEKGKYVIVAVVITGGEPAGFRDEMKAAVKNVESEYGEVLKGWDGGAAQLAGAKRFLAGLGAYKAAEEVLGQKPRADVTLKSEVEFYQGFVRLKVAVKNNMETIITNAAFKLILDLNALRLYNIEPVYEQKGDDVVIGMVGPNEKKTIAFYLDPQICTESYLEGLLSFKDARGNLETVKMPRKLTSVVCPILFTDENINTAMLKRMAADQLDRKDSKVFTIPSNMTSEKAFEIGKAAVQHHDVRLVREFREDRPFRAEAWYYGKAKGRPDKLVVQVRIIPEMSFLEFSVSSDSVLMLTGMLAELKTDLNKELESHKLKGAMKQVTDKDDMEAVAEIRHLLEKATEADSESDSGRT